MKKIILLFFLLMIGINKISADEIVNIKENSIIKYKWYKEEIDEGLYYQKGKVLEGYHENLSDFEYGNYTIYEQKYCSYSPKNYLVESKKIYIYTKVHETRYIKLDNINYENIKTLEIFSKNQKIAYEIKNITDETIIIDLTKAYETDSIWFYIDTEKPYSITGSANSNFSQISIQKQVDNEVLLIPDKEWITKDTGYATKESNNRLTENDFLKYSGSKSLCRVREIKTYRYKIKKSYFDDNYHEYIAGYLPDTNDYIIEYTGELPKEIIEITKTVKDVETKKEYIYLNNDSNENQEKINNDQNQVEISENVKPIIKTKYIENEVIKKVYKTPKRTYFIIALLSMINIIQLVCLLKKKSKKIIS